MDIEWAKDGETGGLYIVQACPETVHSQRILTQIETFRLKGRGEALVEGLAIGSKIANGKAHIIPNVSHIREFQPGEILVTDITDPDREPIMKQACAIVTNRGPTSHAAIVSRRNLAFRRLWGAGTARYS